MQKKPFVSIYLPTRNRSGVLPLAIGSVLSQSWPELELIVVDDASDDSTPEILQQYSEKHRIKVIRNEEAMGASFSRNRALRHASGEFVTGIDDDDQFHPDRIELLLEAFEQGFSGSCSFDKMEYGNRQLIWKKRPVITHKHLLYYNQVGNQLLTRRDYFLEVGGFDERLPAAQDYDLWIRLSERYGPVRTVPRVLQTVNMSEERSRISHSEMKIEGYTACFEKHSHKMSEAQIRYQHYRLSLAAGQSPSWRELLNEVPAPLWFKEIKRKLFL